MRWAANEFGEDTREMERAHPYGSRGILDKVHIDLGKERPAKADFVGIKVPNRYVFGFGMDAYGLWRNLPAVYALKGS